MVGHDSRRPRYTSNPDANSLFQLSWKPEVAWMPADLYGVDGEPIMQTPRLVLKRMLKEAHEGGYTITYSGNNRTHMIRIPDAGRFELQLPDGAANPYLLPAAIVAAGLDGIVRQTDPGDRADYNSYTTLPSHDIKRLPANLLDALRCLEASSVFAKAFGDSVIDSYLKLQYQQWEEYSNQVTHWELERTLDC